MKLTIHLHPVTNALRYPAIPQSSCRDPYWRTGAIIYLQGVSNRTHKTNPAPAHISNPKSIFQTNDEAFPCFFLSCKANARVKLAKTGHSPHSSTLIVICVVRLLFLLFYVLFVCKCVLPLGDKSIAVNNYIISYHISHHTSNYATSTPTSFPIPYSHHLITVRYTAVLSASFHIQ